VSGNSVFLSLDRADDGVLQGFSLVPIYWDGLTIQKGYQRGQAPPLQNPQDGPREKCRPPHCEPAGVQAGRKDLRSQHSWGRNIGVELQAGTGLLGSD
jgi:hypothetical protein